eukprot:m.142982 g.142982  ORF g.142982 m.142982 type:complete len:276 (+) comp14892_c0_seq3:1623-2450(+)
MCVVWDRWRQCMITLVKFKDKLKVSIDRCRDMYFRSGSNDERPRYLVEYMMTCCNNVVTADGFLKEMRGKLEERYRRTRHNDVDAALGSFQSHCKAAAQGLKEVGYRAVDLIIECIMVDLNEHLNNIFTSKWMRSDKPIKTIVATVKDYGGDFTSFMTPEYYPNMMATCYKRIAVLYAYNFMNPKFKCKDERDRENMMERYKKEVELLDSCFTEFIEDADNFDVDPKAVYKVISHLIESPGSMLKAEWSKAKCLTCMLWSVMFDILLSTGMSIQI